MISGSSLRQKLHFVRIIYTFERFNRKWKIICSVCLDLPLSRSPSVSLSVSLSVYLSLSVSVSVSVSLCLSVALSLSLSVSLCLCVSLSVSLSLCVSSLCVSVSHSLSVCLSVSRSLSHTNFISTSILCLLNPTRTIYPHFWHPQYFLTFFIRTQNIPRYYLKI